MSYTGAMFVLDATKSAEEADKVNFIQLFEKLLISPALFSWLEGELLHYILKVTDRIHVPGSTLFVACEQVGHSRVDQVTDKAQI